MFGFGIKRKLQLLLFKVKWRRTNKHNFTSACTCFDISKVTVGNKTYGNLNINLGTNTKRNIRIGNFCSIAPNVNFIINPHNYKFFSTWGWQRLEYNELNYEWENKIQIVVEDDVWIGHGVTILGGVTLHQGCVIGAGAVVTKDVPAYAIYVNGRIIKYRFSSEINNILLKIDYSKIDRATINNIKGWHKIEITKDNVEEFLKLMPLKGDND